MPTCTSLGASVPYIHHLLQDIWVCVVSDLVMGIGTDSSPCARCELMAIGVMGEEVNPAISKAICDVLGRKLSINDDR